MKSVIVSLGIAMLLASLDLRQADRQLAPCPNIIFILVDDLRWDEFGDHGSSIYQDDQYRSDRAAETLSRLKREMQPLQQAYRIANQFTAR